jgi:hypothetical protein
MLAWRTGHVGGLTTDWFNWQSKLKWILTALRDHWQEFDVASLAIIGFVLVEAIRHRGLEYSRNLAASGLLLLLVFILLPRLVFGSAYADMRLVPFIFAVALIAIRYKPGANARYVRAVALAGLAFFLVRTAGTTISFLNFDRSYDRELAALDHVPKGARLLSLVGEKCGPPWRMNRLHHLPGLAIVRKEAFSNDQWVAAGAQLLRVHYRAAGYFQHDASQLVTQRKCPRERYLPVAMALQRIPRQAFDYVWLIKPPPYDPRLTAGLRPIWRNGTSVLFRVER